MNPTEQALKKIVYRIVSSMMKLTENASGASTAERLPTFMGLGITLIYCYEEINGHTKPAAMTPKELIKWGVEYSRDIKSVVV